MNGKQSRLWPIKGFQLNGPDAPDFLQRISTINISHLVDGAIARGLFLGGSSELIAAFYCRRLGRSEFQLVCAVSEAEALAGHVDKMTFAENLELRAIEVTGFELLGTELHGTPLPFAGQRTSLHASAIDPERGPFIWQESALLERGYSLGAVDMVEAVGSAWDQALVEGMTSERGSEWDSGQRALDAGLHFWIDRTKGCYPGQEVVEKSLNLGHPAQVLVLLSGTAKAAPGAKLSREGREVGILTRSTLAADGRQIGLGRVRWGSHEAGTKLDLENSSGENQGYLVEQALVESGE